MRSFALVNVAASTGELTEILSNWVASDQAEAKATIHPKLVLEELPLQRLTELESLESIYIKRHEILGLISIRKTGSRGHYGIAEIRLFHEKISQLKRSTEELVRLLSRATMNSADGRKERVSVKFPSNIVVFERSRENNLIEGEVLNFWTRFRKVRLDLIIFVIALMCAIFGMDLSHPASTSPTYSEAAFGRFATGTIWAAIAALISICHTLWDHRQRMTVDWIVPN